MKDIGKLYFASDIREEIGKQNDKFNLFDFYLNNKDYSNILQYGMYVITPKQDFYCYAIGEHEVLMENILFSIYDDFNYAHKKSNYDWRQTAYEYNNICIQLMSKYYSLVWLPKTINKRQFSKLFEFYDSMKRINDYFKYEEVPRISISCAYTDNGNITQMNLEDAVIFMSQKICESDIDEVIVENNIDDDKKLEKRKINLYSRKCI